MNDEHATVPHTHIDPPDGSVKILKVLAEFVTDVEAVGVQLTSHRWPDLAVTYRNAKAVLAEAAEAGAKGEQP